MTSRRLQTGLRLAAIGCGVLFIVSIGGLLTARYPTWFQYRVAVLGSAGAGDRLLMLLAREWDRSHRFVRLDAKPGGALDANARGLSHGAADLAIVRSDDPDAPALRSVFKLQTLTLVALVPPASDLETGADLKGRKLGVLAGALDDRLVQAAMVSLGIDPGDVAPVQPAAIGQAMRSGRIAAALALVPKSVRSPALIEAAAAVHRAYRAKGSFLDFVEAPAIAAARPLYRSEELTPSVFGAAASDAGESVNALSVDILLVARPQLPRWVASEIAAALVGLRSRLLVSEPLIAQIAAPDPDAITAVELHPGVRAYLDGAAPDPAADAVNLYWIAGGLFALLSPALAWFAGLVRGGSRDPLERRIEALNRLRLKGADGRTETAALDAALNRLLDSAVEALTAGEIDAEGFLCLEALVRHARPRATERL